MIYNDKLLKNGFISNNGLKLIYQDDGNLVLYKESNVLWDSKTEKSTIGQVLFDGNLKVINASGIEVFSTNIKWPSVDLDAELSFQDDSIVIKNKLGYILWDSKNFLTKTIDSTKKFLIKLKNTDFCLDSGKVNTRQAYLYNCDSNNEHQIAEYTDGKIKFKNGLFLDNSSTPESGLIGKANTSSLFNWDSKTGKIYSLSNKKNCLVSGGGNPGTQENFVYEDSSCDPKNTDSNRVFEINYIYISSNFSCCKIWRMVWYRVIKMSFWFTTSVSSSDTETSPIRSLNLQKTN